MAFTVEDLIVKSGVRNINRECSNEDILAFVEFCDPWKQVGLHLGLTEAQLSAIDVENLTVSLKRLGMLHKWKVRFAFKATYRTLAEALLKCEKADATLLLCKILAQKEGKATLICM